MGRAERGPKGRSIAVLPTLNEAKNIGLLTEAILREDPGIDVLVVDDDSPDGTGRIARDMAAANPRVHALIRKEKRGRGWAGIAGFLWALERGYDYIIEMDADFSHHPRYVPAFLERVRRADVVIGSRLVTGGSDRDRSPARRVLTLLANFYIRTVLGIKVRDCTSGYRCFRHRVLASIGLESMISKGPSLVQEVLVACHRKGFGIEEIPIIFEERRAGKSTFNRRIMFDSLFMMWRLRFRRRIRA